MKQGALDTAYELLNSQYGNIKVSTINLPCKVASAAFNRPNSNAYPFLMPVVLCKDVEVISFQLQSFDSQK